MQINSSANVSSPSGDISFTYVGPYSVRFEWRDPGVTANGPQPFKIRLKSARVTYSYATHANHYEIDQLSPDTTYNITVVATEDKCFFASVCTGKRIAVVNVT